MFNLFYACLECFEITIFFIFVVVPHFSAAARVGHLEPWEHVMEEGIGLNPRFDVLPLYFPVCVDSVHNGYK
jgi:hypothetical protein